MLPTLLASLLVHGGDQPAPAASAKVAPPATQVLIVGMMHLGNPGLDLVNPHIKDVLGRRRQQEIEELVQRLQAFRPTKIAVEASPGSPSLQKRLDQYLAGTYTLRADEIDQIGLRLARQVGLSRLHGIDFKSDLDFDKVFHYAQENGQGPLVQALLREIETKIKAKLSAGYLEQHSLREILQEANTPETDALGHRLYLSLLRIGKGKDYPGADLVSQWYSRNLHIAANVARLAEPGERILVLIGAGHGKLLRKFLGEIPGIEVVECGRFLK